MIVVMRILRYLKGTSGRGILFWKNNHLDLMAYTDADWAGNRDDRRSTSSTSLCLEVILLHGKPRNKRWWLYLVQKQSFEAMQTDNGNHVAKEAVGRIATFHD